MVSRQEQTGDDDIIIAAIAEKTTHRDWFKKKSDANLRGIKFSVSINLTEVGILMHFLNLVQCKINT